MAPTKDEELRVTLSRMMEKFKRGKIPKNIFQIDPITGRFKSGRGRHAKFNEDKLLKLNLPLIKKNIAAELNKLNKCTLSTSTPTPTREGGRTRRHFAQAVSYHEMPSSSSSSSSSSSASVQDMNDINESIGSDVAAAATTPRDCNSESRNEIVDNPPNSDAEYVVVDLFDEQYQSDEDWEVQLVGGVKVKAEVDSSLNVNEIKIKSEMDSFCDDKADEPEPGSAGEESAISCNNNTNNQQSGNETTMTDRICDVLTKIWKSYAVPSQGIKNVSGHLNLAPQTSIELLDENKTELFFPLRERQLLDLVKNESSSVTGLPRQEWNDTNFKIMNPSWESFIDDKLLPDIVEGLVIASPVKAILSKLLIVTKSWENVNIAMNDSERNLNNGLLIGHLIVQLPSEFTGGHLELQTRGKCSDGPAVEKIDFSSKDRSNEFQAYGFAFYADCDHHFCPQFNGVRTLLIYRLVPKVTWGLNLLRTIPKSKSVSEGEKKAMLAYLLTEWDGSSSNSSNNNPLPEKLVFVLSHQEHGLNSEKLKNADKELTTLITTFARNYNFTVLTGPLTKQRISQNDTEFAVMMPTIRSTGGDDMIERILAENKHLPLPIRKDEIIPKTTLDKLNSNPIWVDCPCIMIFPSNSFLTKLLERDPSKYGGIGESILIEKCTHFEELKIDVLKVGEFLKSSPAEPFRTVTSARLAQLCHSLLVLNDVSLLSHFFLNYRDQIILHLEDMLPLFLNEKDNKIFILSELSKIFESKELKSEPWKSLQLLCTVVVLVVEEGEELHPDVERGCYKLAEIVLSEYFEEKLKTCNGSLNELILAHLIGFGTWSILTKLIPDILPIFVLIKMGAANGNRLPEPWRSIAMKEDFLPKFSVDKLSSSDGEPLDNEQRVLAQRYLDELNQILANSPEMNGPLIDVVST